MTRPSTYAALLKGWRRGPVDDWLAKRSNHTWLDYQARCCMQMDIEFDDQAIADAERAAIDARDYLKGIIIRAAMAAEPRLTPKLIEEIMS